LPHGMPGRDSGAGQGADIVLRLFPSFAPFAGFRWRKTARGL
jgi:hypothetical protein